MLPCCTGIGTRAIYSVGKLQIYDKGIHGPLSSLEKLEWDWVQHHQKIPQTSFVWAWPEGWHKRV